MMTSFKSNKDFPTSASTLSGFFFSITLGMHQMPNNLVPAIVHIQMMLHDSGKLLPPLFIFFDGVRSVMKGVGIHRST